jgi:hypothetical protein
MEIPATNGFKRRVASFSTANDPDILFAVLHKWFDVRWAD